MKEETPRETPEDSQADENQLSASKSANQAAKDRKCQYCNQAFTSSSLGRHLDQFLFKKQPDGVHDVEEIRRIRSGITRRQARTSSGKRDGSPDHVQKKGPPDAYTAGDSGAKPRDGPVRMMFNTPTWHATGVINDIPNPSSRALDGPRVAPSQSRPGSMQLPDYASRGASANNPDTLKALELALREVLDNIKAATYARVFSFPRRLNYKLTNAKLVPASGPGYLRSSSTFKLRRSPPSACSSSLPLRACSRHIHSPHRRPSRYSLLAWSTSTSSVKPSVPRSRSGSRTNSRRTVHLMRDTQAADSKIA